MTTQSQRPAGRSAQAQAKELPAEAPLLDQVLAATVQRMDRMADEYRRAVDDPAVGRFGRAMLAANTIERLNLLITPEILGKIMTLMGTDLGFRTDRDRGGKPPYSAEVVKRVVIAGLLRGVYPTGNEFNIIAERLYITQEGYARLLRELVGFADLEVRPGIPVNHNGVVVCKVSAEWSYEGRRFSLKGADGSPGRAFPVISHESSSPDQIIGKAKRKALKAIYEQVTGSVHLDAEDMLAETPTAAGTVSAVSKVEAMAERLKAKIDPLNQTVEAPTDEQLHDQTLPASAGGEMFPDDGTPDRRREMGAIR